MVAKFNFPDDLGSLKLRIWKAIDPISPINEKTVAEGKFLLNAQRTNAGRSLPEYYLCYFLLVDLLGFKDLGQFEKISWSVPIDYKGVAYLIEHRKMGLGVFAQNAEAQEEDVKDIVKKITKAVRLARPFFEWKAQEAAKQSSLNVKNYNRRLFEKFKYFLAKYKETIDEAEQRSEERIVTKHGSGTSISFPSYELKRNAEWLALSAIDSFFSWTEHVFIHMAILNGKVVTGEDVADLSDNEWAVKFKKAVDIETEGTKVFYDQLVIVKRQIRNYMAHGAFGKRGEAFSFHSGAGAVPLLLPHQKGSGRFSFYSDLGFDEKDALGIVEEFIAHLWSGEREPAKIYIESDLPLILPMATDGTYQDAMKSVENMKEFVEHLSWKFDQAANMDW
jgi:hypothetical protein